MDKRFILKELKKARTFKAFLPVSGILCYWNRKNEIYLKNKIVIHRDGGLSIALSDSDYTSLSTGNQYYWVWKEYLHIHNFYKKAMLYSLVIPYFIAILFFTIFNLQPFLDILLWKNALNKYNK